MVADEGANFIEREHHQQPPQFPLRGHVVGPVPRPVEERAEHGLGNIVRVEPAGEVRGAILPREGAQALSVPHVKTGRRVIVAGLIPVE